MKVLAALRLRLNWGLRAGAEVEGVGLSALRLPLRAESEDNCLAPLEVAVSS